MRSIIENFKLAHKAVNLGLESLEVDDKQAVCESAEINLNCLSAAQDA